MGGAYSDARKNVEIIVGSLSAMATGKKVWWPQRGVATLEDFDIPHPKAGEVLLEAAISLFNAGSETAFLYGLPNTPSAEKSAPRKAELRGGFRSGWESLGWRSGDDFFPRAPESGSIAGVVMEVGEGVTSVQVGDRVQVGIQPHASHAAVVAEKVNRIPDDVSFQEAVFAAPAHTALFGVQKAVIQLGESVAVVGLGQIGIAAVQFARLNGARPVIGIDLAEKRLAVAAGCGAAHTLNARAPDFEEHLYDITNGAGVNVVIDASGSANALLVDFRVAARFGRVVIVGSPRGITEQVNFYPDVVWKNLFIIGANVSGAAPDIGYHLVPSQFGISTSRQQRDLIFRLLAEGDINFKDMVAACMTLSHQDVQEAYRVAHEERDRALNVILDWTS